MGGHWPTQRGAFNLCLHFIFSLSFSCWQIDTNKNNNTNSSTNTNTTEASGRFKEEHSISVFIWSFLSLFLTCRQTIGLYTGNGRQHEVVQFNHKERQIILHHRQHHRGSKCGLLAIIMLGGDPSCILLLEESFKAFVSGGRTFKLLWANTWAGGIFGTNISAFDSSPVLCATSSCKEFNNSKVLKACFRIIFKTSKHLKGRFKEACP